jgi:hypothetical protein
VVTARPHAKVWVYRETEFFNAAEAETLNPPRWVNGNLGRRAPLPRPELCALDVKGVFWHPDTDALFVDEVKLDRAGQLFRMGFT